jgi:hypothetical protein
MKPLQIALLVVAGALCGAVVMRVVEGLRPQAPVVTAEVPAEQAVPAAPAAPAPAPPVEPKIPPPAPTPETTTPAAADRSATTSEPTPAARPSPFAERHAAVKARPNRPAHSAPAIVVRVQPQYASARPAANAPTPTIAPQAAPAAPPAAPAPTTAPAPPAPPAGTAAPQPEAPASNLPPARSDAENATPPITAQAPPPPEPNRVTLNAGLLIPVRLVDGLSSERNQGGDVFHATLEKELAADGFVIAERGARVEGRVVAVDRGGRVSGVASLAVVLTQVHTSDGQQVAIQTDPFNRHADQTHLQDAEKIGGAAAFGAMIGALAGGGKGAAAGAGVGGGVGAGAVLLTRGAAATLPSETRIAFRLKTPVTVTEQR